MFSTHTHKRKSSFDKNKYIYSDVILWIPLDSVLRTLIIVDIREMNMFHALNKNLK